MTEERRNDVGYKTTLTLFGSILALILGLFINAAWTVANEGKNIAYENRTKITENSVYYQTIKTDLEEIKKLLRRTAPFERVNSRGE